MRAQRGHGDEGCCQRQHLEPVQDILPVSLSYNFVTAPLHALRVQRFRPVLTKAFAEDLHSRGVDVTAVRIEPGQPHPSLRVREMGVGVGPYVNAGHMFV